MAYLDSKMFAKYREDALRHVNGDNDLPRNAIRVAVELAFHLNRETLIAFPSNKTLAGRLGLIDLDLIDLDLGRNARLLADSIKTVKRARDALVERGYLREVPSPPGYKSNAYMFVWPEARTPQVEAEPPQSAARTPHDEAEPPQSAARTPHDEASTPPNLNTDPQIEPKIQPSDISAGATGSRSNEWPELREAIKGKIGETEFKSWVKPLELIKFDSDGIDLRAPTAFMKDWVVGHYLDLIAKLAGVKATVEI